MFDIERYILKFDNYCDRFVNENISGNTLENIHLKITHSKNVLYHCENIAKTENLNAEDFFIAQLCGLFHDIGRFEQFTKYNTFKDDESVYHGALGAEVIEKEEFLNDLPDRIKSLVITAVLNHGLIRIPANTKGKALFFSGLIRDADKADIFGIVAKYYHSKGPRNIALEYGLDDSPQISEKVLNCFLNSELVSKDDLQTLNDFKTMQLAWIFDLNFNYTKQYILKCNFADIVLESITDDKPKDKIRKIIEKTLS